MFYNLHKKIPIAEKETQECMTNILRVIPTKTNITKIITRRSQITILLPQIPMVDRQITTIEGVTQIEVIWSEDESRATTRQREATLNLRDISQKSIRAGHLFLILGFKVNRDQTLIKPKNRTKLYTKIKKRLIRNSSWVSPRPTWAKPMRPHRI